MSDRSLRDLERRARQGDPDARAQLVRERCRAAGHAQTVWSMADDQPQPAMEQDGTLTPLRFGCARCGLALGDDDPIHPEALEVYARAQAAQAEFLAEAVACSLCGRVVHEDDVCTTLACRRCHRTISFDACLRGESGL
jgi:hypothetical protein